MSHMRRLSSDTCQSNLRCKSYTRVIVVNVSLRMGFL